MRLIFILVLIFNILQGLDSTKDLESKKLVLSGDSKGHFADNITTFKANFKQIVRGERGSSEVIYYGNMIANSENKARWIYTKPIKKEVYINEDLIQIYEPLINEVTLLNTTNELDFLSLLKKLKQISKDTYRATIDNVLYTLNFKDNLPYSLEYKDSLENTINIILLDVLLNEDINKADFIFEIPKDADIVQGN